MIHIYGVLIGMGLILGVVVAGRMAGWLAWEIERKAIDSMLFPVLICAVIGARIYHLMTDWSLYKDADFFALISVWNGGLGLYGALLGALVGIVWWYATVGKKRGVQFARILALFSFSLPLIQMVGRLGNAWNQELYGFATTVPWGIAIDGVQHEVRFHPLFAYEIFFLLGLWGIMAYEVWKKKNIETQNNVLPALYCVGYGLIRFLLEFFRPQSAMAGPFTVAQLFSIVLIFGGMTLYCWSERTKSILVRRLVGMIVLITLVWFGGSWVRFMMQSEEQRLVEQQFSPKEKLYAIKVGEHTLRVEYARTSPEIQKGLGGRDTIGSDGMLFFLGRRGVPTFWMKGMRIPLDFVWIDGDRVVQIHENVQPQPGKADQFLTLYSPNIPVTHVLELDAGRIQTLGISVGNIVEIGVP